MIVRLSMYLYKIRLFQYLKALTRILTKVKSNCKRLETKQKSFVAVRFYTNHQTVKQISQRLVRANCTPKACLIHDTLRIISEFM